MRQHNKALLSTTLLAAAGAVLLGAAAVPASQAKDSPKVDAKAAQQFAKALPVLQNYCVSCHSGPDPSGKVDLSQVKTAADVLKDTPLWDRVLVNLRSRTMPPARTKEMPAEPERKALLEAVHNVLRSECSQDDPGRVTIRRLNRFEYANTVRDLLYVDLNPSADFPSDDVGHGFDNIGDVLSLSPLHLDGYLRAAEQLALAALPAPGANKTSYTSEKFTLSGGVNIGDEGLVFFSNGEAQARHEFRQAGSTSIRVMAYAAQAGPEPAKMELLMDGRRLGVFDVRATAEKPLAYELPLDVDRARQAVFALRFINDYYRPDAPAGQRDRNLHVLSLEVLGPTGGQPSASRLARELMPRTPLAGQEKSEGMASLRRFAQRAYRRPVTDGEAARVGALYDAGFKQGGHLSGLRLAVQGILVSPSFLFRAELDGAAAQGRPRDLTGPELASRLSYFVWGSMPDEALMQKAAAGQLSSPQQLAAEADRLLRDPKSSALADSFAMQWLELERLSTRLPDPKLFPGWSEELRKDMVQETKLFFLDVARSDRSVLDFIDGPYTYLNERLARHYGIKGVTGAQFQRVSLEGTPRAGILTQGSILTVTSNPSRTSPVKRGKWVLDVILGAPPPPPPPGVDEIKPETRDNETLTLRDKLIEHRASPQCAVCHQKMDPIGFGLENFDGIGGWREKDGPHPIDSSGTLPGGVKFEGPTELRAILKGRSDEFAEAFAAKLLTYALGRGMRSADRCFVEEVAAAAKKDGYRFSSFIRAIVASDAFRKRAAASPAPTRP